MGNREQWTVNSEQWTVNSEVCAVRTVNCPLSTVHFRLSTVHFRGRRGAAYLLAITTLLVGMVLALAMLRATSGYFIAENSRQKKRAAANLAEAGIDYAFWQLHYNGQRPPYSADVTLATGAFHVEASDDGSRDASTLLITSTGTSGGRSYTLRRAELGMLPYHYGWCENRSHMTGSAVLSSGTMGGIRINGAITLNSASNNVTTGVWAATTINYSGTVTPRYPSSSPVRFPDIDFGYYASIADHTYWGDQGFTNLDHPATGMIVVNGKVNISGWYRGVITIVATDNISVTGSLWPADQSSCLALITNRDISVEVAANSVEAVLYAHDSSGVGDVFIKGATTLIGSAAADDFANNSTVNLVRDTRLNLSVMRSLRLPGL